MAQFGNEIWQTDPDAAFAEADRRVAAVLAGETTLVMADLCALEEMPPGIRDCIALREVDFGLKHWRDRRLIHTFGLTDFSWLSWLRGLEELDLWCTQITDLAPVSGLSNLQSLNFSRTKIIDLAPVADLSSLQSLTCSSTEITNLAPIASLSNLQKLNCFDTQITDLASIAGLSNLQSLTCSRTQITDLAPIAGLSNLESLVCSHTQITDLAPIAGLSNLRSLHCLGVRFTDLAPLANLLKLQSLYCRFARITDLTPIAGLSNLQTLDVSFTKIIDLAPIAGLSNLQSLDVSCTKVTDLAPIAGLSNLQKLDCGSTQVTDLAPIAGLSNLQDLDCGRTRITDLAPIAGLSNLQSLDVSNLSVSALSDVAKLPGLVSLTAKQTHVSGLPDEVLSTGSKENSLSRLRAHLTDLGADPVRLHDVKLMVLGNGRIGKTQVCNRLRGADFEADADSTHGIQVCSAPIAGRDGSFRIWDFGGQDIYHSTHSLFLTDRAVYLLVWTPDSDTSDETFHQGMRFRNRPMDWWLGSAARDCGDAPLLVVQNQTDRLPDAGEHPSAARIGRKRRFYRSLAISAETESGMGALNEALGEAAQAFNAPLIGQGRKKVMEALRKMRETDPNLRILSRADFYALCDDIGGISDKEQFLSFLTNAGEVFWRKDLFDDAVVLDQSWMLDAVYTVFNRARCYKILESAQGRFDREMLADLVWDAEGYSPAEQTQFLEFMEQAGIAFRYDDYHATARYIAPDLLPETCETRSLFGDDGAETRDWTFKILPPALMRKLISRVGRKAGLTCEYWRHGMMGYDGRSGARMVLEQTIADDGSGTITLSIKGDKTADLSWSMEAILSKECRALNLAPIADRMEDAPLPDFKSDPKKTVSYFVSYNWSDDSDPNRDQIVGTFCARAASEGVTIRRDTNEMKLGDRISEFMIKLSQGDRILIILSDKYLTSEFCMIELYEIWVRSKASGRAFLKNVRVFTAGDANIWSRADRVKIERHWKEIYNRDKELILDDLGPKETADILRLRKFAVHVGEILEVIADTLQPKTLDDLVAYALD